MAPRVRPGPANQIWGKTPVQHQLRSQLGIERGWVRSTPGGATIALHARLHYCCFLTLSLHHLFVFCQCAYYVDFSASRLVAVLAELGQKGGILRFIGKMALLWGGIRGAMSLTNRLILFLRISERPLLQRLVLCFYAQEKQLKKKMRV